MSMTTRIEESAIFALTEAGRHQLTEPGTHLQPTDLEVLVLIDGKLNVAQIGRYLPWLSGRHLEAALHTLVTSNYLRLASASDSWDFEPGSYFDDLTVVSTSPETCDRSHRKGVAESQYLKKNGYCTNIARPVGPKFRIASAKGTKVLAIDDDPDVCELLKLYLTMESMSVRTASNRNEITEQLREGGVPDLILLDVVMPGINGFDLLGKIRSHPRLRDVPVVMLTAESSRGGVIRGIAGGANGYVTKPFRVQPLVSAIKSVLGIDAENELLWDTL